MSVLAKVTLCTITRTPYVRDVEA